MKWTILVLNRHLVTYKTYVLVSSQRTNSGQNMCSAVKAGPLYWPYVALIGKMLLIFSVIGLNKDQAF